MMHPSCYRCSSEWGWRSLAPIRSGLRIVAQPEGEQITLAEAKLHLRLDSYPDGTNPIAHPDDPIIESLIVAAREWCENDTGMAIVPQTFELTTSAWPARKPYGVGDEVRLPMPPLASVVSVIYRDAAGVATTLDPTLYTVDNWSEPGWLYPVFGSTWPTVYGAPNAITIQYTAGFTLPGSSPNDRPCPKSVKQAMLLVIGHLYENREQTSELKLADIPLGAVSLLDRFRVRLGIA